MVSASNRVNLILSLTHTLICHIEWVFTLLNYLKIVFAKIVSNFGSLLCQLCSWAGFISNYGSISFRSANSIITLLIKTLHILVILSFINVLIYLFTFVLFIIIFVISRILLFFVIFFFWLIIIAIFTDTWFES